MNQQRGFRAMSLLGQVVRMDVDKDGKASSAFLRARVAIEVDKPLRRGVLLCMSKAEEPRWFAVQYEKLPFYCFACGVMGHSEVECHHPVHRNDEGKLPYDVQLRAPEERKRRIQSFGGAAADSFGSGSSSASRPPRGFQSKSENSRSSRGDEASHSSSGHVGESDDHEVQSPLKQQPGSQSDASEVGRAKSVTGAGKQLFGSREEEPRQVYRKRKSKVANEQSLTPDLNLPVMDSSAIVPVGRVCSRVNQFDGGSENSGESMIETLKKQRRGNNNQNARSAAAAIGSPRRAQ